MSEPFEYVSTFTGIGGFEKGFPEGMNPMCFVEKDKNRQKVLAEHWPGVPQLGDICEITGKDILRTGQRPALYCGGFPCKGVSTATPGRHSKGLTRGDSALWFEFVRLLEETLRLIDETHPRWVLLENVDGLLDSRRGRDFATVVQGLLDLGYGVSWRVVDARYLGPSPQKRRRVLVVGHLGGDPRPAGQVLGIWGPGAEADAQGDGGPPEPRSGANTFALGGDLVTVWRKSSNSQVSIEHGYEGGYRETWFTDGDCNTLASSDGGWALRQKHLISQGGRLRTLSLTEWERLQGFPDDWTAMIPQSARFDALGDAIHVGTAEWVGSRLLSVHNSLPQIGAA